MTKTRVKYIDSLLTWWYTCINEGTNKQQLGETINKQTNTYALKWMPTNPHEPRQHTEAMHPICKYERFISWCLCEYLVSTSHCEGITMIAANGYKTKKELKASIGHYFRHTETSMFTDEFKANGRNTVVGPSAYNRKWYATVTCVNSIITKVTWCFVDGATNKQPTIWKTIVHTRGLGLHPL